MVVLSAYKENFTVIIDQGQYNQKKVEIRFTYKKKQEVKEIQCAWKKIKKWLILHM